MASIEAQRMQPPATVTHSRLQSMRLQSLAGRTIATLVIATGALIILIPFLFMISTSLKSKNQLRAVPPPLIPWETTMVEVAGKREPLYRVTIDGETREMALVKNQPGGMGVFVDPVDPEQSVTLKIAEQTPVRHIELHPENYAEAMTAVPFPRYLLNTLIVTFVGMTGVLLSCTLVAYGFSRFRAPWLNWLFIVLLSTIMLPRQVTLIPVYVLFQRLGWVDTLLPLIVPTFFANAYDVFLIRQFLMTIPLEMDDAAKIDGASPLQTLWHVLVPQAMPVIVTVAIFHFLYAWNDFYEPLIFLHSRHNWTMAVGLQTFNALYAVNTHLIMAASVVMVIPPVLLFFLAQRYFIQGVVISGVKG
ncbi:carbohydrate ABC transporter permease [Caldilinea sp.]|jgi:multiple sugar transport system permease protein|uniref:carbohydrate ABC transporter permease n=1 Tax=Caldilinea sp. TaxID=2293560 RepID=UPI0021DEE89F|nr:carbohydrate ABC transporter permease [Caldilinea sp.]GIV67169.1 MAG: ABC transporter permease [Caldilinea sp.]